MSWRVFRNGTSQGHQLGALDARLFVFTGLAQTEPAMKIVAALTLSLAVALFAGTLAYRSHSENRLLRQQIKAATTSQQETARLNTEAEDRLVKVSKELSASSAAITNLTAQITALHERNENLLHRVEQIKALQSGDDLQEKKRQWEGQVPAPQTQTVMDETGRETKHFVFARLTGVDGLTLATNTLYLRSFGRSILFKLTTGTPAKFDIDELHPGVLAQLGLDVTESVQAQSVLDEQKRRRHEQEALFVNMLTEQGKEMGKVQFQAAIKAAELQAQYDATMAQEHLAAAEALKAHAMELGAQAALTRSLQPPVTVNVGVGVSSPH